MKLEFLENGSPDCPLIRIYGTQPTDFASLLHALRPLAEADGRCCAIDEVSGFQPLDGCSLTAFSCSQTAGVHRDDEALRFEWKLTPAKWLIVAGLVSPFAQGFLDGRHQWLSGREAAFGLELGEIGVVLSCSGDGRW
jgi:hypothetical protein